MVSRSSKDSQVPVCLVCDGAHKLRELAEDQPDFMLISLP